MINGIIKGEIGFYFANIQKYFVYINFSLCIFFHNDNSDRSDILLPVAMKEIVRVPVSPLQNNVIDESLVNVPETQMLVIKPLDGGMRFIKNNYY